MVDFLYFSKSLLPGLVREVGPEYFDVILKLGS